MNIKSAVLALAFTPLALSAMADSKNDDSKKQPLPTVGATLSVKGGTAVSMSSFENISTDFYASEKSGDPKKYDVGATLKLLGKSNVTFEFMGKEAAYTNVLFVFDKAVYNNNVSKGTSVTFYNVKAGKLDFGFQSNSHGTIYENDSSAIAFMTNKTDTSALALFNDAYSKDKDFDDMGVKISVSAVPEPESYALLLAGLGLIGSVVNRRKKNAAA
jgi:hypothetical protein